MYNLGGTLNEIKIIIIYQIVCVFLIVAYGTFRCRNRYFKDPLMGNISNIKEISSYTDGWALSHVFFYMLLGYKYPNRWMYLFITGVIWGIIEARFEDKPFYLSSCKGRENEKWWYGRYEDVISNTIGMMIGISLNKYGSISLQKLKEVFN
jgi:hypothetical protein